MFRWLGSLFARPDPPAEFRARRTELLSLWFDAATRSGSPRGLTWAGYEPLGEPLFGDEWAVLPVLVRFEPTPDGGLEDVPQATEPRAVVAVFNLSAEQVAKQLAAARPS